MILKISNKAEKDIAKLDKSETQKIRRKIDEYIKSPLSVEITKLKSFDDYYRIRQGDYRIVFRIINNSIKIMYIMRIQHRREIYRDL